MRQYPSILLLAVACTAPDLPEPWSPCVLPGHQEVAECAQVEVPLDPEAPDRAALSLHVARVRARGGRERRPPLVLLAGGPGQSGIDMARWLDGVLQPTLLHRDVILLDQRGTGRSHRLACASPSLFEASTPAREAALAKSCAEALELDPRYFGTENVVQDLERVRATLGLGRIALWGGSFGTRTALRYIARFPEQVEAAVLDGVTSNERSLFRDAPRDAQASWQALLSSCRADPACAAAYPDLAANFEYLRELPSQEVTMTDPVTGAPRTTTLDGGLISNVVRGALYIPAQRSLLPLALHRARAGDFSALAAMHSQTRAWASDTMALGATLSILCSEDVDRISPNEARAAAEGSPFEDRYYRAWAASCTHWPRTKLPTDYAQRVEAELPVLLLSGALDPVTPPSHGEALAANLPGATHLVAPQAGHGVTSYGCTPHLMGQFLRDPHEPLDGACLESTEAPPFIIEGGIVR